MVRRPRPPAPFAVVASTAPRAGCNSPRTPSCKPWPEAGPKLRARVRPDERIRQALHLSDLVEDSGRGSSHGRATASNSASGPCSDLRSDPLRPSVASRAVRPSTTRKPGQPGRSRISCMKMPDACASGNKAHALRTTVVSPQPGAPRGCGAGWRLEERQAYLNCPVSAIAPPSRHSTSAPNLRVGPGRWPTVAIPRDVP